MPPFEPHPTSAHGHLDPAIERFVTEVNAAYARWPQFDALSPVEQRAACEIVRAPWRAGGPAMDHTVERTLDCPHGPMRIRLHYPVRGGALPALVFLHGGGWSSFSLETHDRLMREYAARSGCCVVGLDFPLAPEAKFPKALEQIVAAIRWLRSHATEVEIDGARLAVGGDGAGANLAVASCLMLRDAGEADVVRGMVLSYGAFDADLGEESCICFGGPGFMLTRVEMERSWRQYTSDPVELRHPLVSPLRARLERLPAAHLTIAQCDVLTDQNLRMADRLREANVPTDVRVYHGAAHAFLEAVSIAPLAERAFDEASRWLARTLGATVD